MGLQKQNGTSGTNLPAAICTGVVMLFSMVNLKERTQNTVLHTVNTAVLGSCGGGAIFYGRGDLQRGYPYRKRDSGCHAADHAEPYQHCNRHRLSTTRDSDLIVVMDHGRIVESGNHEELLGAKGKYYELYMTQYAGFAT